LRQGPRWERYNDLYQPLNVLIRMQADSRDRQIRATRTCKSPASGVRQANLTARAAGCSKASTYESLVENSPGIGSVEPAPASCRKKFGRHQSSVHAHTIRRLSRRCPVRHAATVPTTVELDGFVAPTIAVDCCVIRDDVYVSRRVVGPQNTITSTDGAVAFCDFYRRDLDL
jgi:hypothetical protein